jgi:catechol 2,3-dioxygenase-like lactoylglutathione lyase family enzyme
MINGAHVIIYSTDAEADRAFFRDVLKFPHVDVGHGWLIFRMPDSELAVHPADAGDSHELYLMCDDLTATMAELTAAGVACEPPESLGWGTRTRLTLPGGSKLAIYQPRHARP